MSTDKRREATSRRLQMTPLKCRWPTVTVTADEESGCEFYQLNVQHFITVF